MMAEAADDVTVKGFDNPVFENDERSSGDTARLNVQQATNHELANNAANGTDKDHEAVNLELVTITPEKNANGADIKSKDVADTGYHDDLESGQNAHHKTPRGEKYYPADREATGRQRWICWGAILAIILTIIIFVILLSTGAFSGSDDAGNEAAVEQQSPTIANVQPSTEWVPTSSTSPPPPSVSIVPSMFSASLRIDEKFNNALYDDHSAEFITMKRRVEHQMDQAYSVYNWPQGRYLGAIRTRVTGFSPGSVVVDYYIYAEHVTSVAPPEVARRLQHRLVAYLAGEQFAHEPPSAHFPASDITVTPMEDLCSMGQLGCSHQCTFLHTSLQFVCVCPEGMALGADGKICTFAAPAVVDTEPAIHRIEQPNLGASLHPNYEVAHEWPHEDGETTTKPEPQPTDAPNAIEPTKWWFSSENDHDHDHDHGHGHGNDYKTVPEPETTPLPIARFEWETTIVPETTPEPEPTPEQDAQFEWESAIVPNMTPEPKLETAQQPDSTFHRDEGLWREDLHQFTTFQSGPETTPEPELETTPEPEPEPKQETTPHPESGAETSEPEPVTTPEPETTPHPESGPEMTTEPESVTTPEPEPETTGWQTEVPALEEVDPTSHDAARPTYVSSVYDASMRLDEKFSPSLHDNTSSDYLRMIVRVKKEIAEAFSSFNWPDGDDLGQIGIKIRKFESGSIVIYFYITTAHESLDAEQTGRRLQKRLKQYFTSAEGVKYHGARFPVSNISVKPLRNVCTTDESGCSHKCRYIGGDYEFRCDCPDDMRLGEDHRTCYHLHDVAPDESAWASGRWTLQGPSDHETTTAHPETAPPEQTRQQLTGDRHSKTTPEPQPETTPEPEPETTPDSGWFSGTDLGQEDTTTAEPPAVDFDGLSTVEPIATESPKGSPLATVPLHQQHLTLHEKLSSTKALGIEPEWVNHGGAPTTTEPDREPTTSEAASETTTPEPESAPTSEPEPSTPASTDTTEAGAKTLSTTESPFGENEVSSEAANGPSLVEDEMHHGVQHEHAELLPVGNSLFDEQRQAKELDKLANDTTEFAVSEPTTESVLELDGMTPRLESPTTAPTDDLQLVSDIAVTLEPEHQSTTSDPEHQFTTPEPESELQSTTPALGTAPTVLETEVASTTPMSTDDATTPELTEESTTPGPTGESTTPGPTGESTTPGLTGESTTPEATTESTTPGLAGESTTSRATGESTTLQSEPTSMRSIMSTAADADVDLSTTEPATTLAERLAMRQDVVTAEAEAGVGGLTAVTGSDGTDESVPAITGAGETADGAPGQNQTAAEQTTAASVESLDTGVTTTAAAKVTTQYSPAITILPSLEDTISSDPEATTQAYPKTTTQFYPDATTQSKLDGTTRIHFAATTQYNHHTTESNVDATPQSTSESIMLAKAGSQPASTTTVQPGPTTFQAALKPNKPPTRSASDLLNEAFKAAGEQSNDLDLRR